MTYRTFTALSIANAVAIGVIFLAWTWPAWSHTTDTGMTFDGWCCNGRDCQEIPRSAVEIDTHRNIVRITLKPGDHPTVTKRHDYTFELAKVRWSTDGLYYACLYPNEWTLRCLYLPPPSF